MKKIEYLLCDIKELHEKIGQAIGKLGDDIAVLGDHQFVKPLNEVQFIDELSKNISRNITDQDAPLARVIETTKLNGYLQCLIDKCLKEINTISHFDFRETRDAKRKLQIEKLQELLSLQKFIKANSSKDSHSRYKQNIVACFAGNSMEFRDYLNKFKKDISKTE